MKKEKNREKEGVKRTLLDYALIILIIIFQPEIRKLLEKVGRSNISFFGKPQEHDEENERIRD